MSRKPFLLENGLYLSFATALIATLGSLYLSEVLGYVPCELCWFQRIFMYPLVVLLGIAAVKQDIGVTRYVLPLASVGICISIFHYALQKVPFLHDQAAMCTSGVPCNEDYLDWWGFVTIPLLCLTAFAIIIVLQILIRRAERD